MSKNKQSDGLDYIGDELEVFSYAENWKKYWSSKLSPLLGQNVLEVGAGIGSNLCILFSKDKKWLSLEPDRAQFGQINSLVNEKYPQFSMLQVVHGTIDALPEDKLFDSVLYIDVLEHIENDQEEVNKAMNLCKIGGKLIVLAPAHNCLYSPFDKVVGHLRRYNKKMLLNLTPENADIERSYYLDSCGCLASFCNAKLLRSTMPTLKQILCWDRIMIPCSIVLDRLLNYSIGKTVLIVWKRAF